MKAQVTQEKFTKALSAAQRVATTKGGLPILNNILLRIDDDGKLLIAATNLEMASTHYVSAKVIKDGAITVPARLLSEYISSLPKGTITLDVKDEKLHISTENFNATLNGVASDDFPELPTINTETSIQYSLNTQTLKQAISQTVFASSSDATRPVLTGVLWHSKDGKLTLAATDGYRLAERVIADTKSELAAIVPSPTLQEVLRLITDDTDEIDVLFDETQVRFRVDGSEITSRLIDGNYPEYAKLIPSEFTIRAEMSKEELLQVTKIASLFARDAGNSIVIAFDNQTSKVQIHSVTSEAGENSSDIDATINESGQVSLNARYLIEALAVIDGARITFQFNGKMSPCVLESVEGEKNYRHIIMPLKS